jgi:hypothetical protein
LYVHFGILGQERIGDADDRSFRRRESQIGEKSGPDPLVHQNPPVLRIIEKLDHVTVPVARFDQVRLRSAAHFADQAARVNGHIGIFEDWQVGNVAADEVPYRLCQRKKKNPLRGLPPAKKRSLWS